MDIKVKTRMESIYKAIEKGWTVRKIDNNTYEFTRSNIGINDSHISPRRSISSPIIKNVKL